MNELLGVMRHFDYTIRWWDHPAGWTVTDGDDNSIASGLYDEQLIEWAEEKAESIEH